MIPLSSQLTFPSSLPADAQPFELLVINICSLSSC
ncbi:cellulose biosynthesis protein BcsG [Escherichia coli]|nr:cellulose biosynthesis protein BcsG [Escherichia coli]